MKRRAPRAKKRPRVVRVAVMVTRLFFTDPGSSRLPSSSSFLSVFSGLNYSDKIFD